MRDDVFGEDALPDDRPTSITREADAVRRRETAALLTQMGYNGHGGGVTGEQLVADHASVFTQQPGWSAHDCADAIDDAVQCAAR